MIPLQSFYLLRWILVALLFLSNTCNAIGSSTRIQRATKMTEKDCFANNGSCNECVKTFDCFFCNANRVCWRYRGTGITNFLPPPSQCSNNNWQIGQCSVNGLTLIILVPIASSLLIIGLTCGLYFCCCRSSYRKLWIQENERHESELARRRHNAELRRFDRQTRRELILDKYRNAPNI